MTSKTNTCKVADLEFDSIGRRYEDLCIKDPVCSSINDFRERIRAITNASFAVGRLTELKERR